MNCDDPQGQFAQAQQTIRTLQEELQQTNSELLQLTMELEDRVAQRTAELQEANKQLEAEIGERQRTQEQIQATLEEREILLKEIHHRVKNNLQLIASLLSMQARRISDPATLEVFADSQSRVHSMALIHERLYKSESLAEIDFGVYVRALANDLLPSHAAHPESIRLDIDVVDIALDLDTAVPCGLIVNELVTNALKYAFPDGREGSIHIGFAHPESIFVLVVRDDGVGVPKDLDLQQTTSLGLRLVRILTEQLEGEISFNTNHQGTEVVITFPMLKSG